MRSSIFPTSTRAFFGGLLLAISAPAFAVVAEEDPVDEGNGETVTYEEPADAIEINAKEGVSGVYIAQVGELNTASLTQSQTDQFASIDQSGNMSRITIDQQGEASHFALVTQSGDFNELDLAQSGTARQIANLQQNGNGNMMLASQNGSADTNGIMATQLGDDNLMSMSQTGSQNHAILTQTGSGNAMTANQSGDNNNLVWSQSGDNLTDLAISQTGGQSLQVTQSR